MNIGCTVLGILRAKPGKRDELRAILEGFVTFAEEFSVILVRGADGATRFWDSPANVHVNGILSTSTAPAGPLIEGQVDQARALAAQVADALDYGVKVTGATVHLVDDGVDTGPVLAQSAVPVQPDDTVDSLHERIKTEERRLLVGTVAALARDGATVDGRKVTIP